MSYTFRVIFDGVCAYVPSRKFFEGTNLATQLDRTSTDPGKPYWETWKAGRDIESMAVLVPDLRLPERPRVPDGPRLNFPSFREPHFPLLFFNPGDLRAATTRRVDLVCRDIARQDERGVLFLRREQLRFNLDAENAETFTFADWVPHNVKQPLPQLDQREQLESLWWLPDLSRIVPDNEKFRDATRTKDEVLPSFRGPFPDGLIARVECTGGRLRTYDFNRSVEGFPLRWRFAKPADAWTEGAWNRALANSVALEFFDVRGEVHIELRRLANEVVIEELVLAPAPGASRPVLEISISNREPDRLFQEEGFARLSLPDMDFQPFYEKLTRFTGNVSELPIPHPAKLSFFGIREKPCAGTVIAPGGTANG